MCDDECEHMALCTSAERLGKWISLTGKLDKSKLNSVAFLLFKSTIVVYCVNLECMNTVADSRLFIMTAHLDSVSWNVVCCKCFGLFIYRRSTHSSSKTINWKNVWLQTFDFVSYIGIRCVYNCVIYILLKKISSTHFWKIVTEIQKQKRPKIDWCGSFEINQIEKKKENTEFKVIIQQKCLFINYFSTVYEEESIKIVPDEN